jgi:hypothetical protein
MFARREPHDSAAAASAHLAKEKPPGFAGRPRVEVASCSTGVEGDLHADRSDIALARRRTGRQRLRIERRKMGEG